MCILMRRAQTPLTSSFLDQREARNLNLRSYFITEFRVSFIQNRGQKFPSKTAFLPRYLCLNSHSESSITHLSFSTYLETLNCWEGTKREPHCSQEHHWQKKMRWAQIENHLNTRKHFSYSEGGQASQKGWISPQNPTGDSTGQTCSAWAEDWTSWFPEVPSNLSISLHCSWEMNMPRFITLSTSLTFCNTPCF